MSMCCFRGAGPVGRLKGHTQQQLRLLADPGITGSQDSHINAAATAAVQQLLVPGVLQQLLEDNQGCDSNTQKQQQKQQQQQQLSALVQLVLQLGAAHTCLADPLQCSSEADSSSQCTEQTLAMLAAAAGYGSTDEMLGICRSQVLEQVRHLLFNSQDLTWLHSTPQHTVYSATRPDCAQCAVKCCTTRPDLDGCEQCAVKCCVTTPDLGRPTAA
jgi:hypothetical protein